jgi:hypothetical protein
MLGMVNQICHTLGIPRDSTRSENALAAILQTTGRPRLSEEVRQEVPDGQESDG